MKQEEKMNKLFYIIIGFILGILFSILLILKEFLNKLNWRNLKKLWVILNE